MAPGASRILVALSGGVDSAVAAALLARQGAQVVGVFMRNGVRGAHARRSCCSLSDARDARAVADRLGAAFYVEDLSAPFASLIERFARDYAEGRTPNPCITCNNELKFGELLRLGDELGCSAVATGHYARTRDGGLQRARDRAKDQSYLLAGLRRGQLARALFPLGDLTKPAVRALARELRLPVADKPDSADICFVPGGDYRAVVRERLGHLGPAGAFVDGHGRELGRHDGVAGFTVGQRRGLGLALGAPAYVTEVRPGSGEVVVGPAGALERHGCRLAGANWLVDPPPDRAWVQLRHHHRPEAAGVRVLAAGRVELEFDRPSRAVCPGQYAVLYDARDDERVLGAGRIEPFGPGPPGGDGPRPGGVRSGS